MLSGIGPKDELQKLDIPIVADLPGVGSHLMDHPVVDLSFMDSSKTSIGFLRPQSFVDHLKSLRSVLQYQLTSKGPLTCNVSLAHLSYLTYIHINLVIRLQIPLHS